MPQYTCPEQSMQALISARRAVQSWRDRDDIRTYSKMTLCRLPSIHSLEGSMLDDKKGRNLLFDLFKGHRDALFYKSRMPLSADYVDSDNIDRLEHLYNCCCSDYDNGVQALVVRADCMHVMTLPALQAIRGLRSGRQHFAFMVEVEDIRAAYYTTALTGPLSPITQHYEIRLSALSVLSSPVSPSDLDEYGPYLQAYYQARVQPNLPYTTEQRTRARQ
ncbi:hypothetical protein B484DRAFT_411258, partial [Ochromonadaceae sp. CCMP2298]